jgi:type II secretion system protein C
VSENLLVGGERGTFLLMRSRLLALVSLIAAASCGGAAAVPEAVQAPTTTTSPAPLPSPAASTAAPPDRVVARSAVHALVAQGLGSFLQRVDVDDQPVFVGGKFHGFRIAALKDPPFWSGVDLKPGDVVTGVNGFPIEHPEQALTAFESLEVASELRVAVERAGQPHELVFPIVDGR